LVATPVPVTAQQLVVVPGRQLAQSPALQTYSLIVSPASGSEATDSKVIVWPLLQTVVEPSILQMPDSILIETEVMVGEVLAIKLTSVSE